MEVSQAPDDLTNLSVDELLARVEHLRATLLAPAAEPPPPDPYKNALAQHRRDDPTLTKAPPPKPVTGYTPPDPYAPGLDKLRKEQS